MNKDFEGKRVLITGATRGIGRATAALFADRGATVIGTGRTEIEPMYRPSYLTHYVACDFTNDEQVEHLCKDISEFGHLDVLVQNAGINVNNPIWNVQNTDFESILRVNLVAPFSIATAVCRVMRQQQIAGWPSGHIVNIGSIWGSTGKSGRSVYSATKGALAAMTRSMTADMAPHGVLVNTVSPGFTKTELTDRTVTPDEQVEIAKTIPLGRFASPAEIARLVVFLCSRENTYITGQDIHIDGGFHNVRV